MFYTIEYAYAGNSKVTLFKNGVITFYKIMNDYNVEGYCMCLEDMGYSYKEKDGE